MKMIIYRVTIERCYTVASFQFISLEDAANFARMAAEHIESDDDGKKLTVHIELIDNQEDENDK